MTAAGAATRRRRPRAPGSLPLALAVAVLALVLIVAAVGPWIAPHDPLLQDLPNRLQGPSAAHWLGTDYLGRDTLSRLIVGTRPSILGALEAVAVGMAIGVLPGMVSVFVGRWTTFGMLRLVDTLMTLPGIVFAIAVTSVFGNTLAVVMAAIGVTFAPRFFRITRAATLALSRAEYVESAELFGATRLETVRRHVFGKVLPTVVVTMAETLGAALLAVAGLTFLGLGVNPPNPSWGGMLASDLSVILQRPWAPFVPGVAILVTIFAVNVIADNIGRLRDARGSDLEDAVDPDAERTPDDDSLMAAGA